MKQPHKHAALIKAWADGAEIEYYNPEARNPSWIVVKTPSWVDGFYYRIKQVPKPDIVHYKIVPSDGYVWNPSSPNPMSKSVNLKLTIDGETGKLKSAEVIND